VQQKNRDYCPPLLLGDRETRKQKKQRNKKDKDKKTKKQRQPPKKVNKK
jgi:hypothetical protein